MPYSLQIHHLSRLRQLLRDVAGDAEKAKTVISDSLPPLDKLFPGEAEKAAASKAEEEKGDLPLTPESARNPLRGLSSGAQAVVAEIEKSHKKLSRTVDKADEKLNELIEVLSGRQALGGYANLKDLMEQLFQAAALQRDISRHPSLNPAELERSIRQILEVIRVWGGPEGQEFFLRFQQILGSAKKAIPTVGKSGQSISSAQSMGGLP